MRSSRPASFNPSTPPQLFTSCSFVPTPVPGFSRAPQCPAAVARALVPSCYSPFPEDPLLPASLSCVPRSLCSSLVMGHRRLLLGLLRSAACGELAPVNPFGCLYPAMAGLRFRDTPKPPSSPHPSLSSSSSWKCRTAGEKLASLPLMQLLRSEDFGTNLASPVLRVPAAPVYTRRPEVRGERALCPWLRSSIRSSSRLS